MHALVVENLIALDDTKKKEFNKKIYGLWQKHFLTDSYHNDGSFNKTILCLLFLNLITLLKKGGTLIFDTAYLEPSHIEILKKHFNSFATWDIAAPENRGLEYVRWYESGQYAAPQFIQFNDYQSRELKEAELVEELVDSIFPENRAIHSQLDVLEKKAAEMMQKGVKDNDYLQAGQVMNTLYLHLQMEANGFLAKTSDLQTFKTKATQAIAEARPLLEQHRGWFFRFVGCLFPVKKTDSAQKIDQLQMQINSIKQR